MPAWVPPSTLEERVKRLLVPPRLELARVVRRELRRGEPELQLCRFLIDRSRNAVDVGANRGVWTHVMAQTARHVHAFEPNPKLFPILNGAAPSNATAHAIALSDRSGEGVLRVPRYKGAYSNQHASLEPASGGDDVGETSVALRTLDEMDVGPVGFVKIDVEGHERAVLGGARETLARDRPAMVVELEERHTGEPIEASLDRVEALGYAALVLRHGRLTPRSGFDPQTDHRARPGQPGYVFNFIFLPV